MRSSGTMNRLYTGEGGVDFIGRRKLWYGIAVALIVISLLSVAIRGFTLGIDFQGGTKMNMPAVDYSTSQVEKTFTEATGVKPELVQKVGSGDSALTEIHAPRLNDQQIGKARQALFDQYKPRNAAGETTPDSIGDSTVSESWGSTITDRMLIAMGAFLVLVFLYIMFRFERDMAISALLALIVDGVVISGTYALIGFEVSPATVIGFLTVLSFSLYDTVVVFDKVKERTDGILGSSKRTYAEEADLAVNQTVMRSIATTVMSALPILALMVIAVWLMGVGTLKDLALVQLIGVIEGTFSSVFLATPFLVDIKERQRRIKAHDAKVLAARGDAHARKGEPEAGAGAAEGDRIPEGVGARSSAGRSGEAHDASQAGAMRSGEGAAAPRKRTVASPKASARPAGLGKSELGEDDASGATGFGASWRPGQN